MRKRVLIFTTSMGHQSLAEAVEQGFASRGWKTKTHFSEFNETTLVYKPIYQLFPSLQKPFFKASQSKKISKIFNQFYSNKKKKREIEKEIKWFKPDLVISTYFLYNQTIEKLKDKYGYKYFNLIANPKTYSPMEVDPNADTNLIYDKGGVESAKTCGFDAKIFSVVGWPTRKQFFIKEKKKKEKSLTVLFCGGSWGTNSTIKFLPCFLKVNADIKLILVSGSNKFLFKTFCFFKKGVESGVFSQKGNLSIDVYQFNKKIHWSMAKADLVIGKAGPNLIFESVATQKPFIAISHISGQEDGCLELIKEKKLGWVAQTPKKLTKLLRKIINDPAVMKKLQKNISKERKINQKSTETITDVAEKLVNKE
jgi:UDP-N-acetylglucosamine:LPS N-acetylglucosamine transferase